ncbi:HBL390Cp [Eremothecium sinecaudum]|uniref:HBL390Cp n=1 Tax=Eremothecium sinecaudum TaxID=45286 RepID=A0A120K0N6_9SACH|nr:HBL390Cp [Eremothecium sinecaudum]AMD18512.1 HBL390Cp [Eremothecium sinecaudum]
MMPMLEQKRSLGTDMRDQPSNPFDLSNYTVRDDSEITTSDEDSSTISSNSDQLVELTSGPVFGLPTTVSEKRVSSWFATRSKSSGVVDELSSSEVQPIALTSFRRSLSLLFRRESSPERGGDTDHESDGRKKDAEELENAKKKQAAEIKSWKKWKGRHFHRKNGISTEPELELEHNGREWEKDNSFDTCEIGKIDVVDLEADASITEYDVSMKKNEVNYARLTRIDIKDLYPDVASIGQDADGEDAYPGDEDSEMSSLEAQSNKLKVKFVDELSHPEKSTKPVKSPHDTYSTASSEYESRESERTTIPSKYEVVIEEPLIEEQEKDQNLEQQNIHTDDLQTGDANSMIYNYIYESPNAKNKSIDLWQVDPHSVTFAKFNQIVQLLNGDPQKIRFRDSLVEVLDYTLSLAVQKDESVNKMETDYQKLKETYDMESRVQAVTEKEINQLREQIKILQNELTTKKDELHDASTEASARDKEVEELKSQLESLNATLSEKEAEPIALKEQWDKEREQMLYEQAQAAKKSKACEQEYNTLKEEYNALKVKWKNIQFDYSRIETEKKALDDKFHSTVASLTAKESTERQLMEENHQLEATVKSKIVALERANRGNLQLQLDCKRERSKLLDLKEDNKYLKSYVDLMEYLKLESLQFMLQFVANFRKSITEEEYMDVQDLINSCSRLKPFSPNRKFSNAEILEKTELDQSLISKMYQVAMKNVLYLVSNKFIEIQRSNKFLTEQLIELRKDVADKEEYIKLLVADTDGLRSKLERYRPSHLSNTEDAHKPIHARPIRMEKKLNKR